jgi:gamma-polyglutamate biosynthesis protein CapA
MARLITRTLGIVLSISVLFFPESIAEIRIANYDLDREAIAVDVSLDQVLLEGAPDDSYKSIYFIGDVMLARHVERLSMRYGHDYPYRSFPALSSTSAVVANFEGSVPIQHVPTPDFTFRFSIHPQFLPALRNFGVTHVSLANNHTLDFGVRGLENTMLALRQAGIEPFGQPNQISETSSKLISLNDSRILILGLMAIDSPPNYNDIRNELAKHDESIIKVAYIHWGPEYISQPSRTQREVARMLVEVGFSLIIGHHPHVVQAVEMIEGVPVFYSLGNFIFDQYFSDGVQIGLGLELLEDVGDYKIRLFGVSSLLGRSQPALMDSEDLVKFLYYLAELSDSQLRDYILQGIIPIERRLAL